MTIFKIVKLKKLNISLKYKKHKTSFTSNFQFNIFQKDNKERNTFKPLYTNSLNRFQLFKFLLKILANF